MEPQCGVCRRVRRLRPVPGGIIYQGEHWTIVHRDGPIWVPGYLFILLNRHCEHLAHLSPEEAAGLGPLIQRTCLALGSVLRPQRVYVCSWGEELAHVHWHIIARTPDLPAGNVLVAVHLRWRSLLHRLGVGRAGADQAECLRVVELLRSEMARPGPSSQPMP